MLGPRHIVVPPRLPWEPIEIEPTLVERLRNLPRSRWVIMGLSAAVTAVILFGFVIDAKTNMVGPTPKVILFKSWDAGRSLADVAADRAAENRDFERRFAESRAYIATLPAAEAVKARAQYNDYAASLKPGQRPADYVAPVAAAVAGAAPAK